MKKDRTFNSRQLMRCCWLMFLSPALRLIPTRTTRLCGQGAWVSVVWSVPLLLLYVLFLRRFTASLSEGEALPSLMLRCLGERGGRLVSAVFAVWFLVYCAFTLRVGAERMITTVYSLVSPAFFVSITVLSAFAAVLGAEKRLMRCAGVIAPAVAAVLGVVLVCALASVKAKNLLPLDAFEVLYSAKGAAAAADAAVLPMYLTLFLTGGRAERTEGGGMLVLSVSTTAFLMNFCIVGSFGAELTARLTQPFFVLARNIVLFRTLERLEAAVVSLWVFSDFVLTSACLFAASSTLRLVIGKRCTFEGESAFDVNNGRWVIWLCAIAALCLALVLAPTQEILTLWSEKLIPYTNLILAFVVLPAVFLVGRGRKGV